MRLRNVFFGLVLLGSCLLFAQSSSKILEGTNLRGFFGMQNILKNPDWETNTASWTASGGTYARNTTFANVGRGVGAGSWDPSSAAQTLTSTAIAIPAGLYNQLGIASCKVKCGSLGACTQTLSAYDGSTTVGVTKAISTAVLYVRVSTEPFVMPSTGSLSLRLTAISSNEPNIYIDDCYLGEAQSANYLGGAEFAGSLKYAATTSCQWTRNAATFADFAADTDCPVPSVSGTVTAPSTKVPHAVLAAALPGDYLVIFNGTISEASNSESGACRIIDELGTVGAQTGYRVDSGAAAVSGLNLNGRFIVETTSAKTFKIQCLSAAGTARIDNATVSSQFLIYRFPVK